MVRDHLYDYRGALVFARAVYNRDVNVMELGTVRHGETTVGALRAFLPRDKDIALERDETTLAQFLPCCAIRQLLANAAPDHPGSLLFELHQIRNPVCSP